MLSLCQAISTHFASSHCEYIDTRQSQENIAAELVEIAKRRLEQRGARNVEITFKVSTCIYQYIHMYLAQVEERRGKGGGF